jgi:hypothetical protein
VELKLRRQDFEAITRFVTWIAPAPVAEEMRDAGADRAGAAQVVIEGEVRVVTLPTGR